MVAALVRSAHTSDFPAISALLAAENLPTEDVGFDGAARFTVAIDDDGTLLGCAAIERRESDALLRSVAVAPSGRRTGLGAALVKRMEQEAAADGVHRLYLLTTSAQAYFAALGYRIVQRSDAPASILSTSQFKCLCPATAVCMMKDMERDIEAGEGSAFER